MWIQPIEGAFLHVVTVSVLFLFGDGVQTDLTSLIDQAVSKYRKVENYEGCVGKIIRQNLNEVNFPQTASTYSP